ncbi:MAG TPA: hypothetical protein VGK26_07480 [Thermoanaerobaculia bacterium]|jgi:hypothetical protein
MRRTALLAAFVWGLLMAVPDARAQLVPLSECGSAIPCNIPKGLRPADAAALSPYGRVGNGNALVGVELNPADGFKPEVMTRSIAEDPSDRAARIFLKNNPGFAMPRTAPTPAPAAAPGKKPEAKTGTAGAAGTVAKSEAPMAPTPVSPAPAQAPQH